MVNDLNWIEINDKNYPMLFSLNVMEEIQNKYGSLEEWGSLMQPENGKEPKISTIIDTFLLIINEGIDYINEVENKNENVLERKQVGRLITMIGIEKATSEISKIVTNSTKDDEPKNE